MLRGAEPLGVLVDNSILGHAVTHETAWISTGVALWGGHPFETGYSARIPVHSANSTAVEYEHIKYLAGIAHLARQDYLRLKTSAELQDETFRQPVGRFRGYGYFDHSLFAGLKLESVDGLVFPTMGPSYLGLASARDQQRARLARSNDPLYLALLAQLGPKNSQDAWHIRTAEAHGLHCFLTMDFRLHRTVRRLKECEPFRSLQTQVLTPVELGKWLGIAPLPPHIFSYTNASFQVRSDLCWPDGKRRPVSAYRKSKPTA